MAENIHLEISGLGGESVTKGFENQIDILSWSWGLSQSGTTHIATGGGSAQVNVSDINFVKYIDKSSPGLIKACCGGKHIDKMTLKVNKAGGDESMTYFEIDLHTCLISSFSTGGAKDQLEMMMENFSVNFAKFELKYYPQSADGSQGSAVPAGWDVAKNQPVSS